MSVLLDPYHSIYKVGVYKQLLSSFHQDTNEEIERIVGLDLIFGLSAKVKGLSS